MSAARFLLLLGALFSICLAAERDEIGKRTFAILVGVCWAVSFNAWLWGWS